MDDVKRRDICGVIKVHGNTEFICTKPPHVKLRLVRPGDVARDFLNEHVPHKFESRFPYRIEET